MSDQFIKTVRITGYNTVASAQTGAGIQLFVVEDDAPDVSNGTPISISKTEAAELAAILTDYANS